MQLSPEVMQQFAETAVNKLVQVDHSIIAAYQCGSTVVAGSALIGGTTDIDIILIHTTEPQIKREILRLTDDVHLDISHHPQDLYRRGRELRVHPWMGPTLNNARPLYDPRHFLDFTQASVRGLYGRPDFKMQRARTLYNQARETWIGLQTITTVVGPNVITSYLKAVENAANSLALLVGEPLTERRLLLDFPRCAEAMGEPRMFNGIIGLLGGYQVDDEEIHSWLLSWSQMFDAIPEEARPAKLHPYRKDYYLRAFEAISGSGDPKNVLWPLMSTWTQAANVLSASNPAYQGWRDACQRLELISSDISDRVAALDAFLDQVDEMLNQWERESGY